jgi:hypothetical protein
MRKLEEYTCVREKVHISLCQNPTSGDVSIPPRGHVARRSSSSYTSSVQPPGCQVSSPTSHAHATTLTFSDVRWDHVVSYIDYPPHAIENLENQLSSLPKINEFFLTIRQHPDFLDSDFPATKIPAPPFHLQKLTVQWWFSIRPPPPIMSQFSTLVANSPNLESLSFGVTHDFNCEDYFGDQVSFEELFGPASSLPTDLKLKTLEVRGIVITQDNFQRHLRHFRHLEKLRIRRHPRPDSKAPENIGEILRILLAERIHLKRLFLDAFHHPGVFEYLTSYTGIEQLSLKPRHILDRTRELMDQFFFSVLPAHSTSLKELRLGMDWTTAWSSLLQPEYQKSLKQCKILEYLYCWVLVELEDVEANNADVLVGTSSNHYILFIH